MDNGTTTFDKTAIFGLQKKCHYRLQIFIKYEIGPYEYSISHNYIFLMKSLYYNIIFLEDQNNLQEYSSHHHHHLAVICHLLIHTRPHHPLHLPICFCCVFVVWWQLGEVFLDILSILNPNGFVFLNVAQYEMPGTACHEPHKFCCSAWYFLE